MNIRSLNSAWARRACSVVANSTMLNVSVFNLVPVRVRAAPVCNLMLPQPNGMHASNIGTPADTARTHHASAKPHSPASLGSALRRDQYFREHYVSAS